MNREQKKTLDRWQKSGLLNHQDLKTEDQKLIMAILLENQSKALLDQCGTVVEENSAGLTEADPNDPDHSFSSEQAHFLVQPILNAAKSRRKEMERYEAYANLKCPTCGDPEFHCHHDEEEE